MFTLRGSILVLLLFFSSILTAAESKNLYNSCKFCHGYKAEKTYMGKIPPISWIGEKRIVNILRAYKAKKRDVYGLGKLMYFQTKNLSDDNIKQVAKYIKELPYM